MTILECEAKVQIGEGLMCVLFLAARFNSRFNRFYSYRNYRWVILVAF